MIAITNYFFPSVLYLLEQELVGRGSQIKQVESPLTDIEVMWNSISIGAGVHNSGISDQVTT